MTIDEQLISVKKELESLKEQKIQNVTRLKSLEEEKQELLRQCDVLGVEPQKIDEIIKEQEELIGKEIALLKITLGEFDALQR